MKKTDFTSRATSSGYMLYFREQPIGGAGTQGLASQTSDGRRRTPQSLKIDLAEYRAAADRDVSMLVNGHGEARYLKEIAKIMAAEKPELQHNVVIRNHLVTPADLDTLVQIRHHLDAAQTQYNLLSDDAQRMLQDMHNEYTWIGYLVRWGVQNCDEVITAVLAAPDAGTQPRM